jgi:hypothetical protein
MVRPLLLAEPGLGDASCTVWTLTVFFHLLYLQAGRPSSKSAFCWSSTLRSSPSVSNLSTFCARLRSYDFHRSFPICRSSALVSDLSIFFDRFQSYDFLRPFPVFRPSPSSCDSNLAIGRFLLVETNPGITEEEIRHGLEGNLCRCTGYDNIVKAISAAAVEMGGS